MIVISGIHIYLTATATAPSVACSSRIGHACCSSIGHASKATRDTNLPELCLQLCFGTGDSDDRALRIMRPQLRLDLGYGKAFGSLGLFGCSLGLFGF